MKFVEADKRNNWWKSMSFCMLLLILLMTNFSVPAQLDTLNKKRLTTVLAVEAVTYLSVMTVLNSMWYDGYPRTSFYTLNDNADWNQMDKVGHSVTCYYVGWVGYEALRWSGVSKRKSLVYGGTLGLIFNSSVEILDGFSAQYGTSWGDVIANAAGTGLFIGQEWGWDEQRVLLKYSYHNSGLSHYSPGLLGRNEMERAINDYNGQTYWMSANIASFLGEDTKFPKWLNLAVGYGADGMIRPTENPPDAMLERKRQYYISLDLDLTRIKTKSKFANTLLGAFGFLKFPLPTVEFNQGEGAKFYGVYF